MYPSISVDFWSQLDGDLLRCLDERQGGMTPTELGQRLGISATAVCSLIGMLAEAGEVRICSVERIAERTSGGAPCT